MDLADAIHAALGSPPTLAVRAFDGSRAGPPRPPAVLVVRSADAISRLLLRPGELGVARAWVAGDLDVEGDLEVALRACEQVAGAGLRLALARTVATALAGSGVALARRLPPPPEEVRLIGRRHSLRRDRDAVTHHYDVSNRFYELVLGPAMTYSCAVFDRPGQDLAVAQAAKHELVCRKLGLGPGDRLLDVGCGWGSMALHAATRHGATVVGITLSQEQAALARRRVADAGLGDRVEIRIQDYRRVPDGPFDAVSSIGMFEHVGRAAAADYAAALHGLMRPGGRLVHHAITRPADAAPAHGWPAARATARRVASAAGWSGATRITDPFMARYVFPDAELFEVGAAASLLGGAGIEVRHVESLREHYAETLRAWAARLEDRWEEAVDEVGVRRARVWRLYLRVSAIGFEEGRLSVHQVLGVRPDRGRSHLPLRPAYEEADRPLVGEPA